MSLVTSVRRFGTSTQIPLFGLLFVFACGGPSATQVATPASGTSGNPAQGSTAVGPRPTSVEGCGLTAETIQYFGISVGTEVVLNRHRVVQGQTNWNDQMTNYLGLSARVTQLAGLDAQGCPCVRVDLDGEAYGWRVRDLSRPADGRLFVEPPAASASAAPIMPPQACRSGEDSDSTSGYGPVRVGTTVLLGRHRPIDGGENWAEEMERFVGRQARVTELLGGDGEGCPGIRVDIDSGRFFWRIRDARVVGGGGTATGPMAVSAGVVTDHGRSTTTTSVGSVFANAGTPGMQDCGLTDATISWGSTEVGTMLILGRHRPVNGHDNWDTAMDRFVGSRTRITQLVGVDDQGCALVRVDADQNRHFWRLRDTVLPSNASGIAGTSVTLAPGFIPDPITASGSIGGPEPADQRDPNCRGFITTTPSYTLSVTAPIPFLRVAVSSPRDATLVVQRPDGSYQCNDDAEGVNPIVEGAFPTGQYRVWVGSYSPSGSGSPYRIGFTAQTSVMPSSLGGP